MSGKTYLEPSREINVFKEVEVLVIGSGPGGISAAIAAAREGADTLLVERYGHLGGMATGGLVLMYTFWLPGQCMEWRERLEKLDGIRFLSPKQGDARWGWDSRTRTGCFHGGSGIAEVHIK